MSTSISARKNLRNGVSQWREQHSPSTKIVRAAAIAAPASRLSVQDHPYIAVTMALLDLALVAYVISLVLR